MWFTRHPWGGHMSLYRGQQLARVEPFKPPWQQPFGLPKSGLLAGGMEILARDYFGVGHVERENVSFNNLTGHISRISRFRSESSRITPLSHFLMP